MTHTTKTQYNLVCPGFSKPHCQWWGHKSTDIYIGGLGCHLRTMPSHTCLPWWDMCTHERHWFLDWGTWMLSKNDDFTHMIAMMGHVYTSKTQKATVKITVSCVSWSLFLVSPGDGKHAICSSSSSGTMIWRSFSSDAAESLPSLWFRHLLVSVWIWSLYPSFRTLVSY